MMLALSLLASGCAGSNGESAQSANSEDAQTAGSSSGSDGYTVSPTGTLAAMVDGGAAIYSVFSSEFDGRSAEPISWQGSSPDGVLAVGQGVSITGPSLVEGLVELRLPLPPQPSQDAIPAAIHVRDDGRFVATPGIWDEQTGELVVWTTEFSDWFGAWWDPPQWLETVVGVPGGAIDFVADWMTGRTDPPPCNSDPPSWAMITHRELASVHPCHQGNISELGEQRTEIYLKSNRSTSQLIQMPRDAQYLWLQEWDVDLNQTFAQLLGGEPGHVLLAGGKAMSAGYVQPAMNEERRGRAYLTWRVMALNALAGIIGASLTEDLVPIGLAVAKCVQSIIGFNPLQLDVVPAGHESLSETIGAITECGLELLANSADLVLVAEEALDSVGLRGSDRRRLLSIAESSADRIKPLAQQLSKVRLGAQAWDSLFDKIADGSIVLSLEGDPFAAGESDEGSSPASEPMCPENAAVVFEATYDGTAGFVRVCGNDAGGLLLVATGAGGSFAADVCATHENPSGEVFALEGETEDFGISLDWNGEGIVSEFVVRGDDGSVVDGGYLRNAELSPQRELVSCSRALPSECDELRQFAPTGEPIPLGCDGRYAISMSVGAGAINWGIYERVDGKWAVVADRSDDDRPTLADVAVDAGLAAELAVELCLDAVFSPADLCDLTETPIPIPQIGAGPTSIGPWTLLERRVETVESDPFDAGLDCAGEQPRPTRDAYTVVSTTYENNQGFSTLSTIWVEDLGSQGLELVQWLARLTDDCDDLVAISLAPLELGPTGYTAFAARLDGQVPSTTQFVLYVTDGANTLAATVTALDAELSADEVVRVFDQLIGA